MKTKVFIIGLILVIAFAGASFAVVSVVDCKGDVKVTPAGSTESVACTVGMALDTGARIITAKKASADIAFDAKAKNRVTIKGGSEVIMLLEGADRIKLVNGEVFTMLKNLKKGETFRVKTPTASCGARGTGWDTITNGKVTEVAVVDGRVSVRGFKKDGSLREKVHWVNKGFERIIKKNEKPGKMQKIPKEKIERMQKTFNLPKSLVISGNTKTLDPKKVVATPRTAEATPDAKADLKERMSSSTSFRDKIESKPLVQREIKSGDRIISPTDTKRESIMNKRDFIKVDDVNKRVEDERKLPPPPDEGKKVIVQ